MNPLAVLFGDVVWAANRERIPLNVAQILPSRFRGEPIGNPGLSGAGFLAAT